MTIELPEKTNSSKIILTSFEDFYLEYFKVHLIFTLEQIFFIDFEDSSKKFFQFFASSLEKFDSSS